MYCSQLVCYLDACFRLRIAGGGGSNPLQLPLHSSLLLCVWSFTLPEQSHSMYHLFTSTLCIPINVFCLDDSEQKLVEREGEGKWGVWCQEVNIKWHCTERCLALYFLIIMYFLIWFAILVTDSIWRDSIWMKTQTGLWDLSCCIQSLADPYVETVREINLHADCVFTLLNRGIVLGDEEDRTPIFPASPWSSTPLFGGQFC